MQNSPGTPSPQHPPADWYSDPDGGDQLRYWDGQGWTAHYAPKPAGLRSVGNWLNAGFSAAWRRAVQLLSLSAALNMSMIVIVSVITSWLIWPWRVRGIGRFDATTSETVLDYFEGLEFEGFSFGRLVIFLLVGLIALYVSLGHSNAVHHQMHWTHRDAAVSWSTSAKTGLRRVPRMVLWLIPAIVLAFLALGIVVGIVAGLLAAGADALAGVLGAVLFLLLAALTIWLSVRLSFFQTAVAVLPSGANPWSTSMAITAGSFWKLVGRFLLWLVIGAVIGNSLGVIELQVTSAALFGGLADLGLTELDATGDRLRVTLDGQPVDSLGFSDFFAGSAGLATRLILVGIVHELVAMVTRSLGASFATNMYVDLNGPADDSGHAATSAS